MKVPVPAEDIEEAIELLRGTVWRPRAYPRAEALRERLHKLLREARGMANDNEVAE